MHNRRMILLIVIILFIVSFQNVIAGNETTSNNTQEVSPVDKMNKIVNLLTFYYTNPQPEQIPDAMKYIVQSNYLDKNNFWSTSYMFGEIALKEPTLVDEYLNILDNIEPKNRLFIIYALTICGNEKVKKYLENKLIDPAWSNDKGLLEKALQQKMPLKYDPINTEVKVSNDLDMLWANFFITGNEQAVIKIIQVTERSDLLYSLIDNYINTNASKEKTDELIKIFKDSIGITLSIENNKLITDRDLDIQYCMNINSKKYSQDQIKKVRLLVNISDKDIYYMAVKSAAFWAVLSNAQQHERVLKILYREYPSLKPTIQNLFLKK